MKYLNLILLLLLSFNLFADDREYEVVAEKELSYEYLDQNLFTKKGVYFTKTWKKIYSLYDNQGEVDISGNEKLKSSKLRNNFKISILPEGTISCYEDNKYNRYCRFLKKRKKYKIVLKRAVLPFKDFILNDPIASRSYSFFKKVTEDLNSYLKYNKDGDFRKKDDLRSLIQTSTIDVTKNGFSIEFKEDTLFVFDQDKYNSFFSIVSGGKFKPKGFIENSIRKRSNKVLQYIQNTKLVNCQKTLRSVSCSLKLDPALKLNYFNDQSLFKLKAKIIKVSDIKQKILGYEKLLKEEYVELVNKEKMKIYHEALAVQKNKLKENSILDDWVTQLERNWNKANFPKYIDVKAYNYYARYSYYPDELKVSGSPGDKILHITYLANAGFSYYVAGQRYSSNSRSYSIKMKYYCGSKSCPKKEDLYSVKGRVSYEHLSFLESFFYNLNKGDFHYLNMVDELNKNLKKLNDISITKKRQFQQQYTVSCKSYFKVPRNGEVFVGRRIHSYAAVYDNIYHRDSYTKDEKYIKGDKVDLSKVSQELKIETRFEKPREFILDEVWDFWDKEDGCYVI